MRLPRPALRGRAVCSLGLCCATRQAPRGENISLTAANGPANASFLTGGLSLWSPGFPAASAGLREREGEKEGVRVECLPRKQREGSGRGGGGGKGTRNKKSSRRPTAWGPRGGQVRGTRLRAECGDLASPWGHGVSAQPFPLPPSCSEVVALGVSPRGLLCSPPYLWVGGAHLHFSGGTPEGRGSRSH